MPRSSRVIGSELKTSNSRPRSSGTTATKPPINIQTEAQRQRPDTHSDDHPTHTVPSQHLGHSDEPSAHDQGNSSPPGSPSMTSRLEEHRVESDLVDEADHEQEQEDSQDSGEGDFWPIIGIVKEKRKNKKISYLVRWASHPRTGKEYPLEWVSAHAVTEAAIDEWKALKAEEQHHRTQARKTKKSTPRASVSISASASPQSVDSSQPVLPAHHRKRRRIFDRPAQASSPADSLSSLAADDLRASKRRRLSADLSSIFSEEVNTDEASDIFNAAGRSICVELPSKATIDTSLYHSVPDSSQHTSTSHSQSVSALEDLDAQIILGLELQSQDTIPDSQDWLDDTQIASQIIARPIDPTVEVPDSQKDSSLEQSLGLYHSAGSSADSVPQTQSDPVQAEDLSVQSQEPEIPSRQPDIGDPQRPGNDQSDSLNEPVVEESTNVRKSSPHCQPLNPSSPRFFTQPDFEFDVESIASSAPESQEIVPESSNAPVRPAQTQGQTESINAHTLDSVEIPQSQDYPHTEQAAQVDPAQSGIAHSQVSYDSSSLDNIVPDTVSRKSGRHLQNPFASPKPNSVVPLPAASANPKNLQTRFQTTHPVTMSGTVPDEEDPVALLIEAASGQHKPESSAAVSEFPDVDDLFDFMASSNRSKDQPGSPIHDVAISGEVRGTSPGAGGALLAAPEPITLPLMPVVDELQHPHEPSLEMATSTEMSGALLQPESGPELFPATISPSQISRTIEPETLMQPPMEASTLSIEDADPNVGAHTLSSPKTGPETVSSPSLQSVIAGQFMVTLPLPANMKDVYLNTILRYRREIETFNNQQSNEGTPPDAQLSAQIDQLFSDLFDICDHPASLGDEEVRQLNPTDLQKHAMGTNSKFYFVGRLLERLSSSDKKVLVVARSQKLLGYLQAIIGTIQPTDRDDSELVIQLAHVDQTVDILDFDVVIGYDSAYPASSVAQQVEDAEPNKRPVVISLVVTYSIEHFEMVIPTDFGELDRKNALLISIFQSRAPLSNYGDQDVEKVVAEFAEHLLEPDLVFEWEPETIPSDLLDFYDNAQRTQTQAQSQFEARQISALKRKHDGPPEGSAKRLRRSQSVAQTPAELEATVRELMDPDPSKVQVVLSRAEWSALTDKNAELEAQLKDKVELETITRKQIVRMSKQIKSHESTANMIHKQHMGALSERAGFERERNEAVEKEQAAQARIAERDATIVELQARLAQAASQDTVLAGLGEKNKELASARDEIRLLEKKLKSKESDFDFARGQYQDERQHVNDTLQENKELREQVSQLKLQFSESLVKIQQINATNSQKDLQRLVTEAQTITRDRERELERAREELRSLKNGRRETRGTSVPRSPRMGVMTPRNGRGGLSTLGASAGGAPGSRGTSPTHVVETPAPPPATPFFGVPSAANGRFNHLRDMM